MASAFGHAVAAFTASRFFPKVLMHWKIVLLGIISSIMPDADVIAFRFGIPYEHMLGHRGITHSIFFAVCWAVLLVIIFHRKQETKHIKLLIAFYLLATVSHCLLDAMTTGGMGVAFFAPFDNDRYFLPWRVIKVSPIGVANFFSTYGLKVLKSEAIYIGLPCLVVYTIQKVYTWAKG